VDDIRFGAALRMARLRRGWRQADLAAAAGVSTGTVSRLERGAIDGIPVGTIRRVARAMEIRVELLGRSRGAEFDRLASARHTALSEAVIEWLSASPRWTIRPEVSFATYGERGVVDVLAWHAERRALLVIELKTEIVDVGELLGTLDRKIRLARAIVERFGWQPDVVGVPHRRRVDDEPASDRCPRGDLPIRPASGDRRGSRVAPEAGDRRPSPRVLLRFSPAER
jgi:transcriptional regulator with XRE-family HTH domain